LTRCPAGGAAAKTWLDERLAKEDFPSPPPLDAALFALSDVLSLLKVSAAQSIASRACCYQSQSQISSHAAPL